MLLSSFGGAPHKYESIVLADPPRHPFDDSRQAAKIATQQTILTVTPTHLGSMFAPGAIGLSIETGRLATQDLSANHDSLAALMRMLGPGVLRIGGNTLDYSWWTSKSEAPPEWATSVIVPSDLLTLRSLLASTHWRTILGVDLGHFDPGRAANEAGVAERILGSRLMGIEIGNEPNGYGIPTVKLRDSSYGVDNYLEEISAYNAAIHVVTPRMPLYGPELSVPNNWLTTISSGLAAPFTTLTEHYYPTMYSVSRGPCQGTTTPTVLNLLSAQVRQQESTLFETLVGLSRVARREARISETNTTASCDTGGGPDTSPVFASALWSLDWVLRAVSAGVAGINFHGSFGVCTPVAFSPMCAPSLRAEARGQLVARPEYYGLLAARELEGGRFIPVDVRENTSASLTAYATLNPQGVIRLAIDNFATEGPTSIVLHASGYRGATDKLLTAPSLSATSNVTFGHSTVTAVGTLRSASKEVPRRHHLFLLKLAPASAVIITLRR